MRGLQKRFVTVLGFLLATAPVFGVQQQIEVEISGIGTLKVLSAIGIGTEIRVGEMVQPDGSIISFPEAVDPGQLVLTRRFRSTPEFTDWITEAANDQAARTEVIGDKSIVHRDIACRQRLGAGTGMHVLYMDAYPVGYDGPDFGTGTAPLESLTCIYDTVFALLAPDPFNISAIRVDGDDFVIEWLGNFGGGTILYANSLPAADSEWQTVTTAVIEEDGTRGSARIPVSGFSGDRFFFRIERP